MAAESTVQRGVWLALARDGCTLLRVNTGMAWLSGLGPAGVQRLADGSVRIAAARPIALGFGLVNGKPLNGAADLCGFTPVVITPEMVGKKVAVFTGIETKRTSGGRTSEEQRNFIARVREAGGIAGVASSEAAARAILTDWMEKMQSK